MEIRDVVYKKRRWDLIVGVFVVVFLEILVRWLKPKFLQPNYSLDNPRVSGFFLIIIGALMFKGLFSKSTEARVIGAYTDTFRTEIVYDKNKDPVKYKMVSIFGFLFASFMIFTGILFVYIGFFRN